MFFVGFSPIVKVSAQAVAAFRWIPPCSNRVPSRVPDIVSGFKVPDRVPDKVADRVSDRIRKGSGFKVRLPLGF